MHEPTSEQPAAWTTHADTRYHASRRLDHTTTHATTSLDVPSSSQVGAYVPLVADLEATHLLNGHVGRMRVVETDKTEAARAAGVLIDHDARGDHVAELDEQLVELEVSHVVRDVEDKEIATFRALTCACGESRARGEVGCQIAWHSQRHEDLDPR